MHTFCIHMFQTDDDGFTINSVQSMKITPIFCPNKMF